MTRPTRHARGFTLVELMLVVAIIGILSSVAFPVMKNFTLRARQSERRVVTRVIKQTAEDFYVRFGRVEDRNGAWLPFLQGPPNPPGVASTTKRIYNPAPQACPQCGWGLLGVNEQFLEGAFYYTYQFWIFDLPAAQFMWIQADGDLDGDGRLATRQLTYTLVEQSYQLAAEWPPAAAGGGNSQDMDLGGVPTW